MGSVFFGCLTATFRSVSALRYGILPFWRDRKCLVQSKSCFEELGEEFRMILTLRTKLEHVSSKVVHTAILKCVEKQRGILSMKRTPTLSSI